MCDEGEQYVEWMYKYFGDCIYNFQDSLSFAMGMMSLICWVIVAWPQMYETYQKKNGESVSVKFLLIWGVGDVANIIGCILTDQLPTQLYVAIWYAISIIILLGQIYYYRFREKRLDWERNAGCLQKDEDDSGDIREPLIPPPPTPQTAFFVFTFVGLTVFLQPYLNADMAFSSSDTVEPRLPGRTLLAGGGDTSETVGVVLGWVSSVFYVFSRVPQIQKNHERKSVEGLSLGMFVFALLGNITYAASILIRDLDPDYIEDALPWLVGSLGTLAFDFIIFLQFYYYDKLAKAKKRKFQQQDYDRLDNPASPEPF